MTKKHTYEFIKEQFEKEGYKLLSKEYINNISKIEYICDKGHHTFITYDHFKSGHRCKQCSSNERSKKQKHTYEFIKSEFEKAGYKLLSTEYINNTSKLNYICNKEHKNNISFSGFRKGQRCSICANKKKYSFEEIKLEFEKRNYILLPTKYKNNKQKLNYICDKGHKSKISYLNFKHGERCGKCFKINNIGENHATWKGGVSKLNLPLFDTYAHQINFCEEVRRDPENNDLLQVRCIKCDKWFTPSADKVESRNTSLKTNKGENRFYCSDECKNTCSIYRRKDYPKGFKVDRSREVQPELAAMVLERDSYECQRCGNKANLECHHYEGIYSNPIESADIDACITFCHQCHKLAHKDKGCRLIDLTKKNLCK